MFLNSVCSTSSNPKERRIRYQERKLEFLTYMRDSLERRLSAINASISTLQKQIDQN